MIEQMLTRHCSSNEEFEKVKSDYQKSLRASGYTHELKYNPKTKQVKRNRKRTVTWFNPPWCNNVKTNIGEKFLKLIDESHRKFEGTALEHIFSRATIKMS